jgi:hypothetical protein
MCQKSRTEYRINKKGSECFRSESFEIARSKFDELNAKRPGVYSMQWRSCPCNKVGTLETDGTGRPIWSSWR